MYGLDTMSLAKTQQEKVQVCEKQLDKNKNRGREESGKEEDGRPESGGWSEGKFKEESGED